MLSLMQRIHGVEDSLTLNSDYRNEMDALDRIEQEIPVYRFHGTPIYKVQQAREEITRIRTWIREELEARAN